MPDSSRTSRRTASSSVSPGSTKPARHENRAPARRRLRPSRPRSPWIASMITTGSVRGKCVALQSGQRRTQPAEATLVREPHWAQKRCRACQSSSERASARIAASPTPIAGASARTSISSVSTSGATLAPVAETEEDQRGPRLDLIAPGAYRLLVERRRLAAREGLQVAQGQDARLRVVEQPGDPWPVFP